MGKRWLASCSGKYLGTYATEEEAARAYDDYAKATRRELAVLNF